MKAIDAVREIQGILGFADKDVDGDIGIKTLAKVAQLGKAARETPDAPWPPALLVGDGTWPWTARIDGADIVVDDARATCFGGSGDSMDSGETASGISTAKNPMLRACALPMSYTGKNAALKKALGGSPIPKVPWKTLVRVTSGKKTLDVIVIDLGPAKRTGNALDLTIAAARFFDPRATANSFEARVSYRILGGAQYA